MAEAIVGISTKKTPSHSDEDILVFKNYSYTTDDAEKHIYMKSELITSFSDTINFDSPSIKTKSSDFDYEWHIINNFFKRSTSKERERK